MHDEEGVGHVVLLPLGLVQLLGQHVVHGALQQVGHLHVPVAVEHAVQSLASAAEAVHRQSRHAEPGREGRSGDMDTVFSNVASGRKTLGKRC